MTPSLVFNISGKADLSAFKAVSLEAQKMTSGFRAFNSMLGTVANNLRTLGVAVGVSFAVSKVNKQLDEMDAIMKRSEKWGISAENIVKLQYAAELADVPIEQLGKSVQKFNEYLAKNGQLNADTFEELAKVADRYATLDSAQKKAALSREMFGKGGAEMIPLLNQGGDAIRKMGQEVKDLGLLFDERTGKQVERFNDGLKRMSMLAQGAARQFGAGLAPGLETIAETFEKATNSDLFKSAGSYISRQIEHVSNAGKGLALIGLAAEHLLRGGSLDDTYMQAARKSLFEKAAQPSGKPSGPVTPETLSAYDTVKILLAEAQQSEKLVSNDREKLNLLQDQLGIVQQMDDAWEKEMDVRGINLDQLVYEGKLTKDGEEYYKRRHDIEQDRLRITREIDQLQKQAYLNTFGGQLGAQVGGAFGFQFDMAGRISNIAAAARDAATAVTSTLGAAFKSISDNISELILGTVTWGQALANIGRSIITQLISAIVNFFVQLAARALLTALIGTAITNAAAAAASAAWAGPAVLASIATYGAAAGVGTGAVMSGLASGIPAATAASIVGGKGYAEGGLVRGGEQFVRINERGPEFVLNANAVKFWGTTALSQMNRGQVPSQVAQQPARFIIVDDRMKAADLMRDPRFRSVIVDMAQT